jgi:hypothetical protein
MSRYGAAAATAAAARAWPEALSLLRDMTRRGLVMDGKSAEELLDALFNVDAVVDRAEAVSAALI